MCMKYINANAMCFKSVIIENNQIVSFTAPFNAMKSVNDEEGISTDDFAIVTQIDILGTNNSENKTENPLESGRTLDFKIRLTKLDRIEENRLGFDVDNFSIDLTEMKENKRTEKACFEFFNYTRMTQINKLHLPAGTGRYVIKVLVKYAEDEEYQIQSMTGLSIL